MDKSERLLVTSSPHIRNADSTRSIMLDVVIALIPLLVVGGYFFGYRVYLLTAVSVAACVVFEYLFLLLAKKPVSVGDFSAVVTGILLALNLPASAPLWLPVVGGFVAIVVGKQVFGGIGRNFANPALVGRMFLLSWTPIMTRWVAPVLSYGADVAGVDAVSVATPLEALKVGKLPDQSLFDMLMGNIGGCLGETSALLIAAGFLYLLYRRVISWHTPVAFVGTVALCAYLYGGSVDFMLGHILSGGLMLGAVFMATDYSTTPVTKLGKFIFGIGCGLITVLIRFYGGYVEGVSFAILFMNLTVFFIDKITTPKAFGRGRKHEK